MKLLSKRLKWAMQEKSKRDGVEVIPADIARAAGVAAASANYWLNDNNGMSAAKARPIAEFLGVDPLWLENGEGEPLKSKSGEPIPSDEADAIWRLIGFYKNASESGRALILDTARLADKEPDTAGIRLAGNKAKGRT